MTEPEISAVALVRIPDWQPPDELDVRELDDSVLVFLEVPFESDDNALLDALEDAIGDAMYDHEEDRGIFFLPDHAEPDDAETYDAVIAEVGALGKFVQFGNAGANMGAINELLADPQALMQQVFGAMGIDDPSALLAAMQGGDPEALKLAQIQMTGALERAMQQAGPLAEAPPDSEDEDDKGDKK
ncbi:MAG: hypothetical protein ACXWUG_29530 [Polyangiales bacterium]